MQVSHLRSGKELRSTNACKLGNLTSAGYFPQSIIFLMPSLKTKAFKLSTVQKTNGCFPHVRARAPKIFSVLPSIPLMNFPCLESVF